MNKDQYAVIGNPITHSKSPLIHAQFAEETGQKLEYKTLFSPVESFKETVETFKNSGAKGLNVTVPFKLEAWKLADELNDAAKYAEAVNTLTFTEDGQILGANTDGIGLVRDLQDNNGIMLAGKRILILGAGGAVQGILLPFLQQKPEIVFIANRTADKATKLANKFTEFGHITGGGFDAISGEFDLIVNGTAASLEGIVPPIPDSCLSENGSCYDMMYSSTDTAFVTWAKSHHAKHALDGLGMLIEQAAESFRIWRGVKPSTSSVFKMLKINE
jgi:shikimate dehydrogenase